MKTTEQTPLFSHVPAVVAAPPAPHTAIPLPVFRSADRVAVPRSRSARD